MDDQMDELDWEEQAPARTSYDVVIERAAPLNAEQLLIVYGTTRIVLEELLQQLREGDVDDATS